MTLVEQFYLYCRAYPLAAISIIAIAFGILWIVGYVFMHSKLLAGWAFIILAVDFFLICGMLPTLAKAGIDTTKDNWIEVNDQMSKEIADKHKRTNNSVAKWVQNALKNTGLPVD